VTRDDLRATKLPPEPASVPAARRFANDAIIDLGVEESAAEAQLLVSELATNAVMHAHTPIRLSVLRAGGGVRVEVRDDDPAMPEVADHMPPELATGGRGMLLVDLLARQWGVNGNEKGKTVWFELP
jgi:anti-sigma regulatory factor (Ser/Thr protein kinase)